MICYNNDREINANGGLASRSGGVLYVWPIGKIVLIAVVIYVFCMLAGHVKKKMIKN